jgi:hypothetical protein
MLKPGDVTYRPTPTPPLTLHAKPIEPVSDSRLVSMREAMEYLNNKGVPCKCRSTFYRIIKEFDIPYTNTNPNGKHEVRRFNMHALQQFIHERGLEP